MKGRSRGIYEPVEQEVCSKIESPRNVRLTSVTWLPKEDLNKDYTNEDGSIQGGDCKRSPKLDKKLVRSKECCDWE